MTHRELLKIGAQELGIELSIDQINSAFIYLAELTKWNRKINLTAIREEREVVIKHMLDSLSFLQGFNSMPGLLLMDMGSGAGFPALPIKLARPELSVTMVESVKKKASFLRHVIRTLKLSNTEVFDTRTEELPDSCRVQYDIVTARAFTDMKSAIMAGFPFLKPGGLLVLSRGPEESISSGDLAKAHVILDRKVDLTLPFSDYRRALWTFLKVDA